MVIKGVKHLAEIDRMIDPKTGEDRFRYLLKRQGSARLLYWGHERTEEAALQMANMYLNLLDDYALELKTKRGPKAQSVQFISAGMMRA